MSDHKCEHCGDSERVVQLPNGVWFCADCDVVGAMVRTSYGWYLDQQDVVPLADWAWNDRGSGPELISPDGVYGPFDGASEWEAEQRARDWLLGLAIAD